jgi:hypothetical protein
MFPNKQESMACGCGIEGRPFHTVSSGTGAEPHSASAMVPSVKASVTI